jgi:hypothetical protein
MSHAAVDLLQPPKGGSERGNRSRPAALPWILVDPETFALMTDTSAATWERLVREGCPVHDLSPISTRGTGRTKRILRFDPDEVMVWLRNRRDRSATIEAAK